MLDSVPSTLSPGTRFGSYEILQRLGAGGMGEVYRAKDTRLDRQVAIKTLSLDRGSQSDALSRFEQEARSACALNHPNIVTIYELGHVNGTRYIAMELVDGETVRALLASGPIPFRKAVAIAAQIADGLAKAHEIGIVHRDLKPENLMVSREGTAKVLDFGLAKLLKLGDARSSDASTAITEHGTMMGTVGYMSPEQATGEEVDFRSDQFAFGSVLYEMVTGFPAFRKKTHAETMAAILRDEPERLGSRMLPGPPSLPLDRAALPRQGPQGALRLHSGFSSRPRGGARPPRRGVGAPFAASSQQSASATHRIHWTRARSDCTPSALEPRRRAARDPHGSGWHREDTTRLAGSGRSRRRVSRGYLLRPSVGSERPRFDRFHHCASLGDARNRESVAAGKLERILERAGPAHASLARQL